MLASANLWVGTAGTTVLWAMSGVLVMVLGFILAAGLFSNHCALLRGIPLLLVLLLAHVPWLSTGGAGQRKRREGRR